MKSLLIAAALLLPALAGPASAGTAAPPAPDAGESLVVQTRGCHADVRRHYVPEYGRTVWHYHNRRCVPVRAGGPVVIRDCHRDVRLHRIRGVLVWHRHVGIDCTVRVVRRSN
jgi:hypothetical protein